MVDAKEAARIQQAIYDEIEKDPVDEKVWERFKSKPYHLRERKKDGKDRQTDKADYERALPGAGDHQERK